MGTVAVSGASLQCGDGGQLTLSGSAPLRVAQAAVLTKGAEAGLSFASAPGVASPCPLVTTSNPSSPSPCINTSAALQGGVATLLTVNKKPVLLGTANGTATPMATPTASPNRTWKVSKDGQATNAAGKPLLTAQ
jgi:hypothetical protein